MSTDQESTMDTEVVAPVDSALEALLAIMERLQTDPSNLPLLREQLRLAGESGMHEAVAKARETLADVTGCNAALWKELIVDLNTELGSSDVSEERIEGILALLIKGCDDYLSISNLRTISEVLVRNSQLIPHSMASEDVIADDQAQGALGPAILKEEQARRGLTAAVKMAEYDIAKSHLVWDLYRDWEENVLAQKQGADRPEALRAMHRVYVNRLATVHSTNEATSQAYSTFNSIHCPEEYEAHMVTATKARTKANARWEARDLWEQGYHNTLNSATPSTSADEMRNLQIGYLYPYLEWELSTDRGRKVEGKMVQGVYERILSVLSGWVGPEGKAIEVGMWEKYGTFMATTNGFSRLQVTQVWQRAARCCPGSGTLWARLIRNQELNEADPADLGETYMRALALGDLTAPRQPQGKGTEQEALSGPIELVALELAWTGFLRRMHEEQAAQAMEGGGTEDAVEATLRSAIERCEAIDSRGDPQMRLERYLLSWLERKNKVDEAMEVFESLVKQHGKSCQFWLDYARFTTHHQRTGKSRTIYKSIAGKPNLDWPESAWEAWITFEEQYGSASTIEAARNRVSSLQDGLAKKRATEAAVQQRRAARSRAVDSASNLVTYQPSVITSDGNSMQVDDVPDEDASRKRKVASDLGPQDAADGSKRARKNDQGSGNGPAAPYKPSENAPVRDREHCTVAITGLRRGTSEKAVQMRFSDCGNIREITVTEVGDQTVAAVEFESIESIPAALTKDKKIIDDAQVNVYVAWNSTLYVTNFPERADDAYIRDLFQGFGTIFGTRWPSKKFSSSRRFVYVQYVDPACAQAALSLHHKELEPGRILNVLISDPDHKRERSDAQADACELFVGSLSKFVAEKDLRRLFEPFGTIKRIKVVEDSEGLCKGFAFVEFETELSATNALSLDKSELKKRQMSVVKSSAGKASAKDRSQQASGKQGSAAATTATLRRSADILSRSLRLKGLPKRSQEGLLQQAIEKIAPVRTVEIFQATNEAAIELQSVADMSKFLLAREPFMFNDVALEIEAETDLSGHSTVPAAIAAISAVAAPAAPALLAPPPRKGGAQKKRLGLGARAVAVSSTSTAPTNVASKPATGETKGQDDFRRMLLAGKK